MDSFRDNQTQDDVVLSARNERVEASLCSSQFFLIRAPKVSVCVGGRAKGQSNAPSCCCT